MRNVYDVVKDEKIKEKALELIETEADLKYRKKYASFVAKVKESPFAYRDQREKEFFSKSSAGSVAKQLTGERP